METLHHLLNGATKRSRGYWAGRVGYISSIVLAFALLVAGLCVYHRARVHGDSPETSWTNMVPAVAMAYGTLLLVAVAIIEIRVKRVRADSLVLRARTLDDLVTHLTQCQEQERERVSMQLHDDVGALLTALKIEIEALENRVADKAADSFQPIDKLLALLIDQVRGISMLLYPRMIGKIGLDGALREMVERLTIADRPVTLHVSGDIDNLNESTALCVLRVAQEGIVNAGRHAQASRIMVNLDAGARCLHGTIDDDGVGWECKDVGMGLTLMVERVRRSGGTLHFEKSPHDGARIRFEIPLTTRHKC